jgi:hypothetical protein
LISTGLTRSPGTDRLPASAISLLEMDQLLGSQLVTVVIEALGIPDTQPSRIVGKGMSLYPDVAVPLSQVP